MMTDELFFDRQDTDANADTERRQSAGSSDIFLASYDSTAAFRFAFALGSENDDVGNGVDIDQYGIVYLTGKASGDVDFDPGLDQQIRSGAPNGSAFLAGYWNVGVFRYGLVLTGGSSSGNDVSTSATGKSIVAGSFVGQVDLDPGPGQALFTSTSGTNAFASRYSLLGDYILGYALDGSGISAAEGVDLNADEGHVITGRFSGSVDVDPTDGVDFRQGNGQTDVFIARYPAEYIVSNDPVPTPQISTTLSMTAPYPNPTSSDFQFVLEAESNDELMLTLYDVSGRKVNAAITRTKSGDVIVVRVNTAGLATGVYSVVARVGSEMSSRSLVVHR